LHHVEHERSYLPDGDLALLVKLGAQSQDHCHGTVDEEVGHEVEDAVPDGLVVAQLVDLLVALAELGGFFLLGGKRLNVKPRTYP